MTLIDLENLESEAYRDSISDGLADLFIGLSLAWVGVAWLWIDSWAAEAAAIPAVLGWMMVPLRRRFLAGRLGRVRWTAPRRQWERKQLKLLLFFAQLSLFGFAGFVLVRNVGAITARNLVAGLPAGLLAVGAFAFATTVGFRRLWGYGAILLAAALVTVLAKAGPGGSLLVSGSVIGVVGSVIFIRFLRANPKRELA